MISYFSSILYHSNTKGLPPSIRQNTRLKLAGLIFNFKLELKLTVYSQCLYFLCFIQCARSWVGISWIFDALNEASKETVYFLCCSTTYIPNQHKLTKYVCQNIRTLKLKGCEPSFFLILNWMLWKSYIHVLFQNSFSLNDFQYFNSFF